MIETSAALPDRPACLPLVRDTIHREEPVSHWSTDNDASVTDGACTRATRWDRPILHLRLALPFDSDFHLAFSG